MGHSRAVASIPGLAQWVKRFWCCHSCSIGWVQVSDVAQTPSLALELRYAQCAAIKIFFLIFIDLILLWVIILFGFSISSWINFRRVYMSRIGPLAREPPYAASAALKRPPPKKKAL